MKTETTARMPDAENSPTGSANCSEVTVITSTPDGRRPETGPMQFGDDWPGVFIRGDEALFSAFQIEMLMKTLKAGERDHALQMLLHPLGVGRQLESLGKLLGSCRVQ